MTTNGHANGQSATNGHTTHNMQPKIILYTNHNCPYAQRAHIALDELNLQYEEVIIDLNVPRPQWYLEINPRGLVPSIKYSVAGLFDEEIITESAIVAQFLCDAFPSHLLPGSKESPQSALTRARIAFFCDTWQTKVSSLMFPLMLAKEGEEKDAKIAEWVKVVEKEIEPLLANAKPFFNGSSELTFADLFAAPFVMRLYALAKNGELLPKTFVDKMNSLPNYGAWAKAIMEHKNATRIFDEQKFVEATKTRMAKMQAGKK